MLCARCLHPLHCPPLLFSVGFFDICRQRVLSVSGSCLIGPFIAHLCPGRANTTSPYSTAMPFVSHIVLLWWSFLPGCRAAALAACRFLRTFWGLLCDTCALPARSCRSRSNTYRLLLWFTIGLPAIREYYEFIVNPSVFLFVVCCLVENGHPPPAPTQTPSRQTSPLLRCSALLVV